MGVEVVEETPSLTGEFIGETYRVLEHIQTHPSGNQHQQGPVCLWVVRKVTESRLRMEQVALFPLGPSPTYSTTMQPSGWPHTGKYLRLYPLLCNKCTKTKKKMAQMKE